jgi:alpha-tubulin suppressor-like RCC1 family protein
VVLSDIPGLNDQSRVSIDMGRGEGVLLPKEDGSFEASDLEPDLYEVRIIYSGGLTSDATESAYETYGRDFTLREGAHVDLGELHLELGTGSIEGQLTPPNGESFPDDTVLSLFDRNSQLEDGDKGGEVSAEYTQALLQSGVDPEGNVSFSNVPVGNYEAVITGEGIRGCLGIMSINEHLQVHQLNSFEVPSTQVRFLSGTDQVFGSDSGRTWFLKEGGVTMTITADFAAQMRVWLGDVAGSDLPEYVSIQSPESHVFTEEDLSEGANVASFQFKDDCGFTSDAETLTLVRDREAPEILFTRLHYGDRYSTSSTVNFSMDAVDAFSESLEMRLATCTVPGEGDAVFAADSEDYVCDPSLESSDWVPYQALQSITFDGEGARGVQVQVRDGSENTTETLGSAVVIDSVPPQNVSVMVEDGSGVITTPQATVNLSADDASYMKLGTVAGLANVGWLSYDNQATVTFSSEDGEKVLYARFKDLAGNESDELVTPVTLDTTGTIEGLVIVEEQADASVALVSVLGTALSTSPNPDGTYTLSGVPAGVYTIQVTIPSAADIYVPTQYGVAVEATQTSSLPNLQVELARGNLTGTIEVESLDAEAEADHSGVTVEVSEAGLTAVTGSSGAFSVTGLVAGSYTVQVTKPGYASRTLTQVSITHQMDSSINLVGTDKLQLLRGGLSGQVALEDGGDATQVEASIPGLSPVTVDSDGAFAIDEILPGNHTLTLSTSGGAYVSHVQPVTILAGQTLVLPAVVLSRAKGAVTGIITLEDETNHSGVSVTLSGGEGQFQAITNGLGSIELNNIPTGDYQLTVEKDDFVTHTVPTLSVNEGETLDIGSVELLIHRGSAFGVATFDDATDHSGIQILFTGAEGTAVTDSNGDWDFPGIKPGFYNVRSVYEGYTAPTDAVYIGAGQDVELQPIVMTRKRGTVTGFVELENMESHAGVTLTMLSDIPELNETFQTTSGPDGNYIFSVPVGNYNGIRATKEHYADTELLGTITVTDFGVANAAAVIFLPGVSNMVSGKATLADLPLGPHDGIQVTVDGLAGTETEGESQSTTTDAAGDFSFGAIPVGSHTVSYTYPADPNREPVTRALEVVAGLPMMLLPADLRELYLVINDGAEVTTQIEVELKLGATDAAEVRMTNDVTFADNTSGWQPYTQNSMAWTLSAGDGQKTVYVQFKTDLGDLTEILSAGILLDSTALASDLILTGGPDFARGDTIHIALTTGETGGSAYVDLQDTIGADAGVAPTSYALDLMLYDDGTHGDGTAEDGVYELDYLVDSPVDVLDGTATGYFTDPHGNESSAQGPSPTAPFTIQAIAAVSDIAVQVNVELGQATITWTTDEPTSTLFDWGLDALYDAQVVQSGETAGHTVVLGTDTPLAQSTVYHFGITATDAEGNAVQTTDQVFSVRPLQPYLPVAMAGDGRVDVRWECPDQGGIVGYNIRRAEVDGQGVVGDFVLLNTDGPYLHEALLYNDSDVANDKTYQYIVSSMDAQDIESIYEASSDPGMEQPNIVEATPLANHGPTLLSGGLGPGIIVWSSSGAPYIIEDNAEVEIGSTLVIAPGTDVYFDGRGTSQNEKTHLTVRGRLAVYGDRGTAFIRDEADQWVESDDGMVTFTSMRSNDPDFVPSAYTWDGIDFTSDSPEGRLDLYTGIYKSGNLFYRTKISHATTPAVSASSATMALIRSTIDDSGAALYADGPVLVKSSQILFNGIGPPLSFGSSQSPGDILVLDSIFRHNIAGAYQAAAVQAYQSTLRILGSKFLGNENNNHSSASSAVFAQSGNAYVADTLFQSNIHTHYAGSKGSVVFANAHGDFSDYVWVVSDCTFIENERVGGALGAVIASPYVSSYRMVNTEILQGHWQPEGPKMSGNYDAVNVHIHNGGLTGGNSVLSSTFTGDFDMSSTIVDWSTNSTATLAYSQFQGHLGDGIYVKAKSGVTLTGNTFDVPSHATGLAVENVSSWGEHINAENNYWGAQVNAEMELLPNPPDIESIYDYYDNASLGKVQYDPWAVNRYPLARIDAPILISAQRADDGFTVQGSATDAEDGVLTGSQLSWRQPGGEEIETGSTLALNGLLEGKHTYELLATDLDGQTTIIDTEFYVIDDEEGPADMIWPDPDRKRSHLLEVTPPDLNPGRMTTSDSIAVDFVCHDVACLTSCALDDGVPAACTSPYTISGLAEGDHSLVIYPEDAQGNALDLPVSFEWKRVPKVTVMTTNLYHPSTAALREDGTLWAWGDNYFGQAGIGESDNDVLIPTQVGTDSDWNAVAVGYDFMCGLKTVGSRWCWGVDMNGSFGNGATGPQAAQTVPILIDDGIAWDTVTLGERHGCGLSGTSLYCWGLDNVGQVGNGDPKTSEGTPQLIAPVGVATGWLTVDAGQLHTCAIDDLNLLHCWGQGGSWLGNGTGTEMAEPAAVSGGHTWKAISAGHALSCGLQTDDSLWCFGNNGYGQLGDGSKTNRSTPVPIASEDSWHQVSAGTHHACAIRDDGMLHCWGRAYTGALGSGTHFLIVTDKLVPTPVNFDTDWEQVFAGRGNGTEHTCAIKSGALVCFGGNEEGQLGVGDTVKRFTPQGVLVGTE